MKSTYLDSLRIKLQAILLVDQKLLNIFTLITLKLNHLPHLGVVDNGAIASCEYPRLALTFGTYRNDGLFEEAYRISF